jgi:hypothetical protein
MKKTLLSFAIGALFLAAPRVISADVSVEFFYNNLSGGSWIEAGDYGYCWQPDVAVSDSSWRPYADGYWAYTDLGWTWVSYEDFGWATYHYGRWARFSDYGWVWVPGRDADLEWGPAWVSWRTGGEYVGWAPLPPETIGVVEIRPLTGHLDVEFNIGPEYYNFVDVRYIGEPVLRERIVAPTQNITYIQQTVNVTNITYRNTTVYNYGPDIDVINRASSRPIQRLRLDREQNVDVTAAVRTGGLTKVQGDRLVVSAPMHVTRSARQAAPPVVKTTVAAAKIDRGWSAVGDEKAQAEFKQRIRSQNLKNVPPAATASATDTQTQANAAGGGPSPVRRSSPAIAASPAASANAAASTDVRGSRGLRAGAAAGTTRGLGESPQTNAASGEQGANAQMAGRRGARGQGQGNQQNRLPQPGNQNAATSGPSPAAAPSPVTRSPVGSATDMTAGEGAGPGRRTQGRRAPTGDNGIAPGAGAARQDAAAAGQGQGQGPQARRGFQNRPAETAPGDLPAQGGGPRRQGGQSQAARSDGQERRNQSREGQGQGQGEGRSQGRGKKGQGEASPAATPQG